jgi:addiction module RelB/DinJ family antitoxin
MAKTMINARIDADLKADVEKVFKKLGLTTTQAINIFLNQVRQLRGLPFPVECKSWEDVESGLCDNRELNEETKKALRESISGKGHVLKEAATRTAGQLLKSEVVGLWKRRKITDSTTYARELREKAQQRSRS